MYSLKEGAIFCVEPFPKGTTMVWWNPRVHTALVTPWVPIPHSWYCTVRDTLDCWAAGPAPEDAKALLQRQMACGSLGNVWWWMVTQALGDSISWGPMGMRRTVAGCGILGAFLQGICGPASMQEPKLY